MKKRRMPVSGSLSWYTPLLFISILIAVFVLSLMLYPYVSRVWAASPEAIVISADSITKVTQSTTQNGSLVYVTEATATPNTTQPVLKKSTTQLAATGKLEKILTLVAVAGLVFSTITLLIVLRNSK